MHNCVVQSEKHAKLRFDGNELQTMAIASRIFWTALSTAAAIVCLAGLTVGIAGAIFVPADSANILAPFWLAFGIAAIFATLALNRRDRTSARRLAAWAAFIAMPALGLVLLAPLAAEHRRADGSTELRVVSFNLYKSNADPDRVVRWLVAQHADVIVLLEATAAHNDALETLRHSHPYRYACSGSQRCSTRVFSRFPATGFWPLARGDADNRQTLSALTIRFDMGGREVPLTAVHLSHPWPLGEQQSEIEALARALSTVGKGGIVAGDFNSAPWTFAMRRLAASADARLASGGTATWPVHRLALPLLPLDQIYLGRCLAARSVTSGPALGSDHLPLVADIDVDACNV
jgi:endonuclease/exonuclease/phosphatase (EEP) superfamily protein YafD